jgi:hypothetical protein
MLLLRKSQWVIICFISLSPACRKNYDPPVIEAIHHFLSVDGFVNTGTNAISAFTLSRSRNLYDTATDYPAELNAHLTIMGSSGNSYSLLDTFGTGVYTTAPLNLDGSQSYKLAITTSDNNQYESDFVFPKPVPKIDSVNWMLTDDPVSGEQINIFVNTHDPNEATHYYRWDFLETYEHVAFFEASWYLVNGLVYPYTNYDSATYYCYTTLPARNILLGSSIMLSHDVISQALINTIPKDDSRLDINYSILVRQYPLNEDSYKYWLTIQKNAQSLGGLFDLQPSEIKGNFHSLTQSGTPVLGYLSAGTVSEKRIFINHSSVPGWRSTIFISCPLKVALVDPLNYQIYNFYDPDYGPYYFSGAGLVVAPNICIDCRLQGGTNHKPDYWGPH